MKHLKVILFFAFFFTWVQVFGQGMREGCDTSKALFEQGLSGEVFYPTNSSTGSSYFIDEWLNGDVWLTEGPKINNKRLRYDGLTDDLYWLTENTSLSIRVDKGLVSAFTLYHNALNTSYAFHKIKIPQALSPGETMVFAQLLYEGDLSLYVQRKVVETASTAVSIINGKPKTRILLGNEPLYYIQLSNNEMIRISRSKKSLLRTFPEMKKEIAAELRKNRIRFKRDHDFIEAMEIIDLLNRN